DRAAWIAKDIGHALADEAFPENLCTRELHRFIPSPRQWMRTTPDARTSRTLPSRIAAPEATTRPDGASARHRRFPPPIGVRPNRLPLQGVERGLFALEHARRPAMVQTLGAGDLHHRAFRRQVAGHDQETAGRLQRPADLADDLLARRFSGGRRFVADRAA